MNQLTESSILFTPAAIACLANEEAYTDMCVFLDTLEYHNHRIPPIYCFCSSKLQTMIEKRKKQYRGVIHFRVCLDSYSGMNRSTMEQLPSQRGFPNLFYDFTVEKCALMKWALESLSESEQERGVLFCDADIVWMNTLIQIPKGKTLALSPHMIRKRDEASFGEFNAGFLWTNQLSMPDEWAEACTRSRFFEQAALEELADLTLEKHLYRFDETVNYGWWRMFQSDSNVIQKQNEWTYAPESPSGICVNGKPLVCIHTHCKSYDFVTKTFNLFVKQFLTLARRTDLQLILEGYEVV